MFDTATRLKASRYDFRSSFAFIVLLSLVFISCGRNVHGKLPTGYIDAPPLSAPAVLRGVAAFQGWALADDGIEEVAVYIDRQYVVSADIGVNRPDVAKAFPKEPNAGRAGWRASVNTTNFSAGVHEVVVQATGKSGAKRDIAAFPATIAK